MGKDIALIKDFEKVRGVLAQESYIASLSARGAGVQLCADRRG
jgi:hypothetical protein